MTWEVEKMKEYTIYNPKGDVVGNLSDENVKSVVENNFKTIVDGNIGNAAGYVLEEVWLEYDEEAKHEGTAKLHIVASGSESLVDFDPIDNPPKEVVYTISGVDKSELPEKEYFDIKPEELFDPFDKKWLEDKGIAYGIFLGTVDFIGKNRCMINDNCSFSLSSNVELRFSTLEKANFPVFVSQVLKTLNQHRPKNDKQTQKLLDLVHSTHTAIADVKKLTTDESMIKTLYYYKTLGALDRINKVTALFYYRNKLGKTQQQVADEVGISLRQYQRYEAVNSTLSDTKIYVIEKIASVLNVSIDKIYDGVKVVYKTAK